MQVRKLTFASALLLGTFLALPTSAQQIEPKAREAAEGIVQAYNKAGQAKDAIALANVYTADAILVMPLSCRPCVDN